MHILCNRHTYISSTICNYTYIYLFWSKFSTFVIYIFNVDMWIIGFLFWKRDTSRMWQVPKQQRDMLHHLTLEVKHQKYTTHSKSNWMIICPITSPHSVHMYVLQSAKEHKSSVNWCGPDLCELMKPMRGSAWSILALKCLLVLWKNMPKYTVA